MGTLGSTGFDNLTELDREALAWVEVIASGRATLEDLDRLKAWRTVGPAYEEAFTNAVRLKRLVGVYPKDSTDHYRATVFNRPSTRRNLLAAGGAVAACSYLVSRPPLGLWPSLAELMSDYQTGVAERQTIALAQGVGLDLNGRTSLVMRNTAAGPGVELVAGEMAVSADLPSNGRMHVIARSGRIEATAANLDIRNDDGVVRVSVLEGAAWVRHPHGDRAITPRQQITYTDTEVSRPAAIDPLTVTAWRRGLLIFHNARLGEVVTEVNRYRSGKIVLMSAALTERRFSGDFRIDRLDDVVTQIRKVANASATSLPGGVVLLS